MNNQITREQAFEYLSKALEFGANIKFDKANLVGSYFEFTLVKDIHINLKDLLNGHISTLMPFIGSQNNRIVLSYNWSHVIEHFTPIHKILNFKNF